jgi:hypothetical protein
MKRSELVRKTPLRVKAGLTSRTALVRRQARTKKPKATGPVRGVVDLVYERANYSCELCLMGLGPQRGVDHHVHHRRPRRAGGSRRAETNSAANLLLLCPSCHEVIEVQRTAAYDGGWLVGASQDPALVPVLIGAVRLVYLTDDGRYVDDIPGAAEVSS